MKGLMQDVPLMISSFISYAAKYHGDTEIVSRMGDGSVHHYGYAEAEVRAKKLAQALTRLGVKAGDRVATMAWSTYRHFECFYGVSCMGAVLHTVNPRLFEDQIRYIVNHAEDSWLLLDTEFLEFVEKLSPDMPTVKGYIILADADEMPETSLPNVLCYEDLLAAEDGDYAWPVFDEHTASSLCYTSGTTGNPKGVLYSHRSNVLHAFALSVVPAFALDTREVMMALAQMFHANAWAFPYAAPMNGAKLVLPGRHMDGASLHELIEAEGVTVVASVPTVLAMLIDHLDETGGQVETLKQANIGGAAVPPALARRCRDDYGIHVIQGWGMTETSPHMVTSTPTPKIDALPPDQRRAVLEKAGRAQFGAEFKIVGPDGEEVPADGESFGDIWVRGNWVAAAYFRSEAGDVRDAEGWFPTGDVGTVDEFGVLQITDRTKDVIKSGGEWISSIEIENLAIGHPKVRQAAVIGVAHPKWQERPLLLVVPEPGESPDKDDVLAFLAPKIAKWWLPDDMVVVDELPLTATGKISKKTLRQTWRGHLEKG